MHAVKAGIGHDRHNPASPEEICSPTESNNPTAFWRQPEKHTILIDVSSIGGRGPAERWFVVPPSGGASRTPPEGGTTNCRAAGASPSRTAPLSHSITVMPAERRR